MEQNCSVHLLYNCGAEEVKNSVSVGAFRYELGFTAGDELYREDLSCDCVVPVPNSGKYYAMGFAAAIQLPYIQALVKLDSGLCSARSQDQMFRTKEISENIAIIPALVKGKKIALVDEAVFSGTTLKTVIGMLREHGAEQLYVFIPTPPCINCCRELPQKELIMNSHTQDSLGHYLGADSVCFISTGSFRRQMAQYPMLCHDCFK